MPRYSYIVALVLSGTTILVGCGGNSPDATPDPTIAEFVAAADATCMRIGARFETLPDPDGAGGAKPLGVGGDFERSGEAQGEALWSLEAKAQRHFRAMHVPFRVCWVE